jgi:multidrug resistance efflux pump
MIVFLTLLYVGVLAVLVKLRIVPLNTFWKLSPLLWMLLLFVVLFIPMQWGAPSGTVKMYSAVVEVIPNVSGEVEEITARPLEPMQEGDLLFRIERTPFEARVEQLEADLEFAEINLARAAELVARQAGPEFERDKYRTQVKSLQAQLKNARWELDQTEVRAPGDGYVVGLSLQPGQRVGNLPVRSWMAYVDQSRSRLAAGIPQSRLRHVKPGQPAEVVFNLYPGRTFTAQVVDVVDVTSGAQLQPSGILPNAPTAEEPPLPYGVILELEEVPTGLGHVPGGALGTAAIYTDSVKATHVIRRIMMRMQAWMNYVLPY